ncbi:MAG: hypothetical protein LBN95_13675 [Prevotellaceae bacterium]|jgi:hypothetical protein|nr:hypothetical protein [Prevotellaceae bacterium]
MAKFNFSNKMKGGTSSLIKGAGGGIVSAAFDAYVSPSLTYKGKDDEGIETEKSFASLAKTIGGAALAVLIPNKFVSVISNGLLTTGASDLAKEYIFASVKGVGSNFVGKTRRPAINITPRMRQYFNKQNSIRGASYNQGPGEEVNQFTR